MSASVRCHRLWFVLALAVLLAAVAAVSTAGVPRSALAQTDRFVADDGDDAGNCSDEANPCATIGYAIGQANEGDTINVAAGTYTEPGLVANKDLTLRGAGAASTIIQAHAQAGMATDRVLEVTPGSVVTIDGVTIRYGKTAGSGGGISVSGGEVMLTDSAVSDNEAAFNGGGIFIEGGGKATLIRSTVSSNTGDFGGGIDNEGGELTVNGGAVSGNTANGAGGGIVNDGGSVTLIDVTIGGDEAGDGNHSAGGNGGGAIFNFEGPLSLTNTSVNGNSTDEVGGGIHNERGDVMLVTSTIAGNTSSSNAGGIFNASNSMLTLVDSSIGGSAPGQGNVAHRDVGGVYNFGELTVVGSTVSGNVAMDTDGGGIYNFGNATVMGSTISGNTAMEGGGGMYNASTGTLIVVNSTLTGNTDGLQGGGIRNTGTATFMNSTISDNTADEGGGIYIALAGPLTLINTIVADQQAGGDCAGDAPISGDHNLDSDGTCGLTKDSDISEGDANLGPLADNGGPTLTHALLDGSDAIDAGDDTVCAAEPVDGVDQRGVPRPQGEACDIGAFELGVAQIWGDLDCDGNVVIGDALKRRATCWVYR